MVVIAYLRLILWANIFNITLIFEKPIENGFLNLLIIFFFKEFVAKELHRPNHEQLSSFCAHINCRGWSICWKTYGSSRKNRLWWLSHVYCCSIWIHKFEPTIFISVGQLVFRISIFLRIFTRLCPIFFLSSISSFNKSIIQTAVPNKGLLGMQVFMERLSDDWVGIDAYSYLL